MKTCIHCGSPSKHVRDGYHASVCQRGVDTWTKYKVNCVEYDWMQYKQDYTCANPGCDKPAEHLDHNHETGEVRAFLCSGCNKALGYLGEDFQRMAGLIQYLQDYAIRQETTEG